MSKLTKTNNPDNPWFIAKEVCDVLGLGNSRDAVNGLDDDEKNTVVISDGTPGNPHQTIINEPGLYSLILRSRKPEAREFKRWVTHEVLPQIRETCRYIPMEPEGTREMILVKALKIMQETLAKRDQLIEAIQSKATNFDQFVYCRLSAPKRQNRH